MITQFDPPKRVFSRTLQVLFMANTTIAQDGVEAETRKVKAQAGDPIVVFDSGTIVFQLADAGLVDEDQLVVNPIVLGKGRSTTNRKQRRPGLTRRSPHRLAFTTPTTQGETNAKDHHIPLVR